MHGMLCRKCGKQLYKNGNCRGCSQRGIKVPSRGNVSPEKQKSLYKSRSKRMRGNQHLLGHHHSNKTKMKMSKSQKGKSRPRRSGIVFHTEEWKKRASQWLKGNRNGLSGKNSNTSIELKVKSILEGEGLQFEQQKHFKGIGSLDFYLDDYGLDIECDGKYWHNKPGAKERDKRRDKLLKGLGIKVLRLPENEINKKIEKCKTKITRVIERIRYASKA